MLYIIVIIVAFALAGLRAWGAAIEAAEIMHRGSQDDRR